MSKSKRVYSAWMRDLLTLIDPTGVGVGIASAMRGTVGRPERSFAMNYLARAEHRASQAREMVANGITQQAIATAPHAAPNALLPGP